MHDMFGNQATNHPNLNFKLKRILLERNSNLYSNLYNAFKLSGTPDIYISKKEIINPTPDIQAFSLVLHTDPNLEKRLLISNGSSPVNIFSFLPDQYSDLTHVNLEDNSIIFDAHTLPHKSLLVMLPGKVERIAVDFLQNTSCDLG